MLVEKEIIAPGKYWYIDERTQLPRVLDVDVDLVNHWHSEGSKMIDVGLPIPVPYEHDFSAHPMTPKEKLLGNAGEVREYRIKDFDDPVRGLVKNALFGVVDVQDPEVKNKIGHSIRWTSPWFNSFTDGDGRQWNNVIAHLALTTKPRITRQSPFPSTQAALSLATSVNAQGVLPQGGYCLSKAGLLSKVKKTGAFMPRFPMAFSLFSGAALGEFPPKKGKEPPQKKGAAPGRGAPPDKSARGAPPEGGEDEFEDSAKPGEETGTPSEGDTPGSDVIDLPPLGDQAGDVSMEEVLCDLLRALGVNCEHSGDEGQFKRNLYTAAMQKVHELTSKGMNQAEQPKPGSINKDKPPGAPGAQPNPLVQQEQQPMYMSHNMSAFSLEDINKLPDGPVKSIALSMYAENERLRVSLEANQKVTDSLKAGKLKEAEAQRSARVALLSKISPRIKADLEAMCATPGAALSLGDGGVVFDPMDSTLKMLEKQLAGLPELLKHDSSALAVQPHPRDSEEQLSNEEADKLADDYAKRMGVAPEKKAS